MATKKDSISVRIAKNKGRTYHTHYRDCIDYIENYGKYGYNNEKIYEYCMKVDCPEVREILKIKDRCKDVKKFIKDSLDYCEDDDAENFLNFIESVLHKRRLPDSIQFVKSEIKFHLKTREYYNYKNFTKTKQDENEAMLIEYQDSLKDLRLEYKKSLLHDKILIEELLKDEEIKSIDVNEEEIAIITRYKRLADLDNDVERNLDHIYAHLDEKEIVIEETKEIVIEETNIEDIYKQLDELEELEIILK